MYVATSLLVEPPDGQNLFKYLDFWQFEDLLQSRELYLRRLDRFPDAASGQNPAARVPGAPVVRSVRQTMDGNLFVNCWSGGDINNDAYWARYTDKDAGDGLALVTTAGKLKKAIIDSKPLHMGVVQYTDDAPAGDVSPLVSACSRHTQFRDEQEVRLLYHPAQINTSPAGVSARFTVDLPLLIQSVRISPYAPASFASNVRRALRSYALAMVPCQQARLYRVI